MKRKNKKNYKRLSNFDRSLIMGLIIESLKNSDKEKVKRFEIHKYVKNNKNYMNLIKNLGFLNSELLKRQYESLIDNNLSKLVKNGIIKINNERKYKLTAHGEDLWVKYNKDWFLMSKVKRII